MMNVLDSIICENWSSCQGVMQFDCPDQSQSLSEVGVTTKGTHPTAHLDSRASGNDGVWFS